MKSMLLLVAALVDARTTDPLAIKTKVGDFDFYTFSMHHQPEFCRWVDSWHMPESPESGCHRANVPYKKSWEGQLTIHGLWPALYNGSHPTMCTDEKLHPAFIAGLEVALEQNWTNIRSITTKVRSTTWSYDDTSLWSHEWHYHGTCSGMDQYTYFSTALQLLVPTPPIVKERYRSDGGVGVVTRSELLAGYSFSTAVAEADSSDLVAIISCDKDGYLSEVHICYEKKNITNLHHYIPQCYSDELCKEECLKQRKVCRAEVAAKNIPLSAAYNDSNKICNTDTDECMHNELLHATHFSPHDGGGESNVGKRILCPYTMNWMDNCGENIKIASFINNDGKLSQIGGI
jgi:ribonuclease T2